jgi:uncharacterized protein (TIGR00255 family)
MIRSMTGYGTASVESEALRGTVSVRSLNHRYLDVALQVPRRLRALEPEIKGLVQSRLGRGRVEVTVQAVTLGEGAEEVVASKPLVAGVVRALREIQAQHGLEGGVQVSDVVRFAGTVEVETVPNGLEAETRRQVLGVVAEALDGLEQMRRAEGEHLASDLEGCLGAVEASAQDLDRLCREGQETRRETLVERVRALTVDIGLDESRLYQEVARLVDRHDVSEELQRLGSHVAQARELLRSDEPCGKRLDFLAQELMREANTLGSKAASAEVVHTVVGLKSLIEKLREQVQNVE